MIRRLLAPLSPLVLAAALAACDSPGGPNADPDQDGSNETNQSSAGEVRPGIEGTATPGALGTGGSGSEDMPGGGGTTPTPSETPTPEGGAPKAAPIGSTEQGSGR